MMLYTATTSIILLTIFINKIQSNLQFTLKSDLAPLLNPNIPSLDCKLPKGIQNLQPIKSDSGWATETLTCSSGNWCPYACEPGYYSTQWDPSVICLDPNHCGSTHGGLFCNNGKLIYPFPDTELCKPSADFVVVKNEVNSTVSLCQTVYPGSEIMLISTETTPGRDDIKLTTLPKSYWMSTGAHFYVNPIGSTKNECRWGDSEKPYGNWAPYLVGSNWGYQGNLYLRIGINPNFNLGKMGKPGYKMKVECIKGECVNADCKVDVENESQRECIVTVKEGSKARITFCN